MEAFVGIDVSKEEFDACGIDDEGRKIFSLSCWMNREGFDKLVLQLPVSIQNAGQEVSAWT
jgi:hypothetical protein